MKAPASNTTPLLLTVLAERLAGCGVKLVGGEGVEVLHVTEDSRRVEPGTLFVARAGETSDGTRFAEAAMTRGARAVLCEAGSGVTVTPRLEANDFRQAWGRAAQELYGRPSEEVRVVGITGTNGKTTVASLVSQALSQKSQVVARAGTLGCYIGSEKLADSLTTPQPDQLGWVLSEARVRGAVAAVLEVSSHALDQQRVAGVHFEVGAFTNLTQDHLDYHETMEAYGAAKARLFREAKPKFQVLNIDDTWGAQLASELESPITVSPKGNEATIACKSAIFGREGVHAVVVDAGTEVPLRSPLLGQHNLENLLVAWGILKALGVPSVQISAELSAACGVAGRLERCEGTEDDVVVVVDYAHTPDALCRALETLSELNFDEIVCVFGCGGDRDRKKRPKMGEAVAKRADRIYATSDNPRQEDPLRILADIRVGLSDATGEVHEIVDRGEAIRQAVLSAAAGSVVLIAGKGHEDYQLVGDEMLPFDDRVEARRALALRRQERSV